MPVKYDFPSKEVIDKYYRELGVTDQTLRRDVEALQSWMEKQPHLPHNVDAKTLGKFLIHSRNSLERAKSKLEGYYTARSSEPDILLNRDPLDSSIKHIAEVLMHCPCPKPTPEGDRVTLVKFFDCDLKRFDPLIAFKVGLMLLDGFMDEELCRKHVVVLDLNGGSLGHAATYSIPVIKKIVSLLGVFPQRFHGIHVINSPSYFESVVAISKRFLYDKLAKRIYCHGSNLSSLHQHVPRDVLPPEYGGTLPLSVEQLREMSYRSLVERRGWFLEQSKIHSDEDKRPDRKLKKFDSTLEGSFRKILID